MIDDIFFIDLRIFINADPAALWPDIIVDPTYTLEAAVEYLRNME